MLTSLLWELTLVFHDCISVYAATSENVTADTALDASFIQGMASDNLKMLQTTNVGSTFPSVR